MLDSSTQLVLGATFLLVCSFLFRKRELDHIPTVGYSHPFLSVISSIRYVLGARSLISEGYRRYPGHLFKIPTFDGWTVIANGTQQIDDIRRSSEEQMGSMITTAAYFQFRYTLGPRLLDNPFHVDVIRMAMTRNIGARYQDIHEEVVRAYTEAIPSTANDWVPLTAYNLQVDVISRVSSRYFVGQPLCENLEFRNVCERATMEIFKGRFLRIFPTFMRPFASWLLTDIHGLRSKMENFLQPLIEYRLEEERHHGSEWSEKPNDLITWLMDAARSTGEAITAADLSSRVLFISFGAIHTSSAAFTAALYQLCLSPKDAQELREEVENVIKEEGWSKSALGKMQKVDSYLRESQRMHFMSVLTMGRTALQDFTFSDGTVVPKNTSVAVNVYSRHRDQDIYPDPHVFNGFRFVRKAEESQPLLATPTLEYHSFGHGRPSCPGRFFAVAELKTMLAHIVTNYDIRLEKNEYPPKLYMEANAIPNQTAKILFRKRQA